MFEFRGVVKEISMIILWEKEGGKRARSQRSNDEEEEGEKEEREPRFFRALVLAHPRHLRWRKQE